MITAEKIHAPVHPGEILHEEFLERMDLTANALTIAIGVPAPRIYEIVKGKRSVTADTALRLARFFNTSAEFWINLQAHYDLEVASVELGDDLDFIRPAT